jgi:hypothetical protein
MSNEVGGPRNRSKKPLEETTMLKISSLTPRALVAALIVASVLASAAWAQQPPPVRIRGTIESVDGATLMIKSRDGIDTKVRMTDSVAVVRRRQDRDIRNQARLIRRSIRDTRA